jgi:hypothetical protein
MLNPLWRSEVVFTTQISALIRLDFFLLRGTPAGFLMSDYSIPIFLVSMQ